MWQMSRDVQTIAMDLELVNWKLAHAFAQDSKELIVVSVTNHDYKVIFQRAIIDFRILSKWHSILEC